MTSWGRGVDIVAVWLRLLPGKMRGWRMCEEEEEAK